jgi:DNA polymerase-3 subunit chi
MTAIAFHVNAPDKLAYTCRLLRKAASAGSRVLVSGEPGELARLGVGLWAFSALDFVPHCRADAPPAVLLRSPIVLALPGVSAVDGATVRVHLGGPMDETLDDFERVIEVVGEGEQERVDARARWRHYSAMGHSVSHHDIAILGQRHG